MADLDGPRVLYIVYWGALEPLGQSLVLPSVRGLSRRGVRMTLLTYEKPADRARPGAEAAVREALAEAGVAWAPLTYHKRPKVPATAWDVLRGTFRASRLHARAPFDIVHARTFVAGHVGLVLGPLLRRPWVYHNEGFYPDEQVDAGVWRDGSAAHRVASRLETALYRHAAAWILLSARSRPEAVARAGREPPLAIVPSCVDLSLFPSPPDGFEAGAGLRLAYVGNVEGRYLFERVARFASVAGAELRVLTRAPEPLVRAKARAAGLGETRLSVASVPHAAIGGELARCHAGLHFLPQGRAEHTGSPTKIGEYWASGLPAVVTPNMGDCDRVIAAERVGVVVAGHGDADYAAAAGALQALLADPAVRRRCRAAAERHYALEAALDAQVELYRALARKR